MAFLRKVRIIYTCEFFEENILRHTCFKMLLLNDMKLLNPNSSFIPLFFRVLLYPKFNLYFLYTEKAVVMMAISSSQWVESSVLWWTVTSFNIFLTGTQQKRCSLRKPGFRSITVLKWKKYQTEHSPLV